ncbi:uncharacterized protein G2W53_021780 [Senna tora]|uniref:Uncharacterized protein n=1 Tax=Senna tora TaxID=362788 RepID=A0A834TMD7_9FABA|nr:uncharacterized protein G2W53_021780 [Senna tora]
MYLHCRQPPYRTPATVVNFSSRYCLASPISIGVEEVVQRDVEWEWERCA